MGVSEDPLKPSGLEMSPEPEDGPAARLEAVKQQDEYDLKSDIKVGPGVKAPKANVHKKTKRGKRKGK